MNGILSLQDDGGKNNLPELPGCACDTSVENSSRFGNTQNRQGAMLSRLQSGREIPGTAAAKACLPRVAYMLSRRPCCCFGSEKGRESMAPSVKVTQVTDAHRGQSQIRLQPTWAAISIAERFALRGKADDHPAGQPTPLLRRRHPPRNPESRRLVAARGLL